jgi:hypothetical protein
MTIPKRKMKYLSLMIIKKQLYRMNMAQVAHSCKIVMKWKGKIDEKIYLSIFLKKFENILKIEYPKLTLIDPNLYKTWMKLI